MQGCREGDIVAFLTARDELIAVLAAAAATAPMVVAAAAEVHSVVQVRPVSYPLESF